LGAGISTTGVAVNQTIHTDPVSQWNAGDGGVEDIGLSDQERSLVAAPGVTLNSDSLRVYDPGGDGGLDRGNYAGHCGDARVIDLIYDIRLDHRVAVAGVVRDVEAVVAGLGVLVRALGQLFVDIYQCRVTLPG
jgi:hypothetical protein